MFLYRRNLKTAAVFFLSLFCFGVISCSRKGEVQKNSESVVSKPAEKNEKIDIDFSKYNYNIASSMIFDMLINQDKYLGKRIKISGQFFSNFDEANNCRHYSVLFYDATACCQTGLQFILKGSPVYPEDFPAEMAGCSVTGIFSYKELNGMDYLYLDCDKIDVAVK